MSRSSTFRWPVGGVYALFFVVLVHTTISLLLVPDPIADQPLRRKVLALTDGYRPWMIVAGDSRAQVHVRPDVLASFFGWPEGAAINIGMPVCEVSSVLAAYREFSDRFAPHPIMLISVSLFSVNDGAQEEHFIRDETIWSLSFFQRFWLLSPGRAFLATFLPEKALVQRLMRGRRIDEDTFIPEFGFVGKVEGDARLSSVAVEGQIDDVKRCWFGRPRIDAIRWRRFESDLRSLIEENVQVVLLDSPVHPAFWNAISETPQLDVYRRFREKLKDVASRMDIPLLQYSVSSLGNADPDSMFFNLTHLSRRGATVLSDRIAHDLRELVTQGTLIVPPITRTVSRND